MLELCSFEDLQLHEEDLNGRTQLILVSFTSDYPSPIFSLVTVSYGFVPGAAKNLVEPGWAIRTLSSRDQKYVFCLLLLIMEVQTQEQAAIAAPLSLFQALCPRAEVASRRFEELAPSPSHLYPFFSFSEPDI